MGQSITTSRLTVVTMACRQSKGSDFLGPISTHIGPHWIQEYDKFLQTVVEEGMKKLSGNYIVYFSGIDGVCGHLLILEFLFLPITKTGVSKIKVTMT